MLTAKLVAIDITQLFLGGDRYFAEQRPTLETLQCFYLHELGPEVDGK